MPGFALIETRTNFYHADAANDREGRRACLIGLVDDLLVGRASELFLEGDDSLITANRRLIRSQLDHRAALDWLTHQHVAPAEHPMLWVSDAVAWCQQAGADWLSRSEQLIERVVRL